MRPAQSPDTSRLVWAYRGLLLAVAVVLLIWFIIFYFQFRHHAHHRVDCMDHCTLSGSCNDNNPCTADKICRDATCVNRNWPIGHPCESTCLVPNQTSSLCMNGKCLALPTDCRGYCDFTFTEDCDATDPACLEAIGCPPLPLGVGYFTPLPAVIIMQRAACVMHSCRYGVFTTLPGPAAPLMPPILPSTTAACSEWLNRSSSDVLEGCYDTVRTDFTAFDIVDTHRPLPPFILPPNTYEFPLDLSAAVGCTYSFHCAPYDTTLPAPEIVAFDAAATASIASKAGRGAQTGSTIHDVYALRSYLSMAVHALHP